MATIGGRPLSAIVADSIATGLVVAGVEMVWPMALRGGIIQDGFVVSGAALAGGMVSRQLGLQGIISGFGL